MKLDTYFQFGKTLLEQFIVPAVPGGPIPLVDKLKKEFGGLASEYKFDSVFCRLDTTLRSVDLESDDHNGRTTKLKDAQEICDSLFVGTVPGLLSTYLLPIAVLRVSDLMELGKELAFQICDASEELQGGTAQHANVRVSDVYKTVESEANLTEFTISRSVCNHTLLFANVCDL